MVTRSFEGLIDSIEPLIKGQSNKYFLRFGMKDNDLRIQWTTAIGNWSFIHLLLLRLKFAKKNQKLVKIKGPYNQKTNTILLKNRHGNSCKVDNKVV